jgi:hypothetical protein
MTNRNLTLPIGFRFNEAHEYGALHPVPIRAGVFKRVHHEQMKDLIFYAAKLDGRHCVRKGVWLQVRSVVVSKECGCK